ncbi:MAG: hypothetical protein R6T83_12090 [Salinibacter sp.]
MSTCSSRPSPEAPESPNEQGDRRAVVDRFVAFWGTMASSWGINRTMARVHALLYCAERPLNTDDIMGRLQISRGSANMNLRALVDWRLAEKTTVPDSRKDHYTAEKDVWRIMARVIEERERREVRPVRQHLRDCVDDLQPAGDASLSEKDRILYERLQNLTELMTVVEEVSEALLPLIKTREPDRIRQLVSFIQALNQPDNQAESEPTPPDAPESDLPS